VRAAATNMCHLTLLAPYPTQIWWENKHSTYIDNKYPLDSGLGVLEPLQKVERRSREVQMGCSRSQNFTSW